MQKKGSDRLWQIMQYLIKNLHCLPEPVCFYIFAFLPKTTVNVDPTMTKTIPVSVNQDGI